MKRSTIFILAAAVVGAALVLYVATSDSTTQPEDAIGTIGAADPDIPGVERAERYRADQIGDEAVTLDNPAIQELLQDDEVLRLVQDPAFQRAMDNVAMRQAIQLEEFNRIITLPAFQTALLRQTLEFDATTMNRAERVAFANELFANSDLARLTAASPELLDTFAKRRDLAEVFASNAEFARALATNEALQTVFAHRELVAAMADLQRQNLLGALPQLHRSPQVFQVLATEHNRTAFFRQAEMQRVQVQ